MQIYMQYKIILRTKNALIACIYKRSLNFTPDRYHSDIYCSVIAFAVKIY